MRRTALAIALVRAACGHDAPPPAPQPRTTAPVAVDAGTTSVPPQAPNLVVERITTGSGELFVRVADGCEPASVRDKPGASGVRLLELQGQGPLGCNPTRAQISIDVTDRKHLRATGASLQVRKRSVSPRPRCNDAEDATSTQTPSAREAILGDVHVFVDRASCDASPFAAPVGARSCLHSAIADAIALRRDDVPTAGFIARFDALLADPKATVWSGGFGGRCDEYRVERQPHGVTFKRTWKERDLTVVRESYWEYDPVCKRAAWGGSSLTKTLPDGGGTGSAGGGNDELPLEASDGEPDALPLYPGGWFYTRRACERSSFK